MKKTKVSSYKSNSICFYHDDSDGIMSAAIVKSIHPDTECIAVQHGYDEVKFYQKYEDRKYDFIFVVDFSFTARIMALFQVIAKHEFVWIDHHQSAKDVLHDLWNSDNIGGLRDITKSGCLLTWEWFHPHERVPKAIQYVNDYDLWTHALSNTKPFHEAFCLLCTEPKDVKQQHLIYDDQRNVPRLIGLGEVLMQAKMQRVKNVFKNGVEVKDFHGYKTYSVNCPHDISDLGNYIVEQGYEIAIIYYNEGPKRINYSLRSKIGSDVDVGKIAKEQYNGGGHKHASGYFIEEM